MFTHDQLEAMALCCDDLVGAPYLVSGRSKSGADCYGVLVLAYRSIGIKIPEPTVEGEAIFSYFEPVQIPFPGDAFHFVSEEDGQQTTHVGIFIKKKSSDMYAVHSSRGRGVIASSKRFIYREYGKKGMKFYRLKQA